MITNNWIRQFHRWVSMVFMVTVLMNLVALMLKAQTPFIGFVALVPLILLMISGTYMFAQPYLSRLRRAKERQLA